MQDALPFLAQFLAGESVRKSPSTVRNHRMALVRFGAWLRDRGLTAVTATALDLDAYCAGLHAALPGGRANWLIGAARAYLRWLHEVGTRPDDPRCVLRFARTEPREVQALDVDDLARLVRFGYNCTSERFGTARTAALLVTLADTGLRVGEAIQLRVEDCSFSDRLLRVRSAKTHSLRYVPLSRATCALLESYLARRAMHLSRLHVVSEWLFPGGHGGRWTVGSAERSCRTVARKAGIVRRIHPHLLRHTWARLMLIGGAPLPAVMQLAGWRRLATAQRYTQLSLEPLMAAHEKASPVNALLGRANPGAGETVPAPAAGPFHPWSPLGGER